MKVFFEENSTQTGCIEIPLKTGIWKNTGDSFYKITNIDIDEAIKITFENDKMAIELTVVEDGVASALKLIFTKVNS